MKCPTCLSKVKCEDCGAVIPSTPALVSPTDIFGKCEYVAGGATARIFVPARMSTWDGYDAFMTAVGQGDHWTVTEKVDRLMKIGTTPMPTIEGTGYTLAVDATPDCPRARKSRNDIIVSLVAMPTKSLLYLPEYAILFHFLKSKGTIIDENTFCWLMNAWDGSGALLAYECAGAVGVGRYDAAGLALRFEDEGGRVAEVVGA